MITDTDDRLIASVTNYGATFAINTPNPSDVTEDSVRGALGARHGVGVSRDIAMARGLQSAEPILELTPDFNGEQRAVRDLRT